MAQTVVLKVGMSCQGCVGAVQRVLTKMEGVESFDINKEEQKVTVKGNVKPEDVFQTVSKTGKKTSFWESEPEPEAFPLAAEPEKKTEPEPETTVTTTTVTATTVTDTTVTADAETTAPTTTA
ncbi:hypothetical protein LUZ60_004134 [Juncus effusus]|nr:hypothetical protein LUZ60_004134 [Juncus effusus]